MEPNLAAILGVIVAMILSMIAIFRLRSPSSEQPVAPATPDVIPPLAEVFGLFADADGEKAWNYLDPTRHTLFIRLRGTRRGPLCVGLEVDGRVDDIQTVTIGENTPIEKIHSFPMAFPKYNRYRSPGLHQIAVLTGYPTDDPRADPIWVDRIDYQVEVVQR